MDYKQEADKIVEMFKPYAFGQQDKTEELFAIKCAIKAVEMQLQVACVMSKIRLNKILNQLKQM